MSIRLRQAPTGKELIAGPDNATQFMVPIWNPVTQQFDIGWPKGGLYTWGAAVATAGQFFAPGAQENGTTNATEGNVQIIMPSSYIIRNLWARAPATTAIITVRKGGVDTTLTCTCVSNTASDVTHFVTGNAQDLISISCGGAAGGLVRIACEIVLIGGPGVGSSQGL